MEKLTAFFDGFDLSKLVPQMDVLLEKLQIVARYALLIGPIVMLVFGLWYLLLPPKEATHSAGFRTWFGMGSVEAWRMAQKMGGYAWSGCGLVLLVAMWLIGRGFGGMDPMEAANTALTCLIWQTAVALASYVAVGITMMVLFDSRGCRRGRKG